MKKESKEVLEDQIVEEKATKEKVAVPDKKTVGKTPEASPSDRANSLRSLGFVVNSKDGFTIREVKVAGYGLCSLEYKDGGKVNVVYNGKTVLSKVSGTLDTATRTFRVNKE